MSENEPASQSEPASQDDNPAQNDAPIIPASASWIVDFIMNVSLKSKDGTDIPLYNKIVGVKEEYRFSPSEDEKFHYPLIPNMSYGEKADWFDYKTEDYWLFYVQLNHARMQIVIGGETPVYADSDGNWMGLGDHFKYPDGTARLKNSKGASHYIYYSFGHDKFNRFIGVRCPKMDNPAISLRVHGNYGGLHWVGLFAKTATDNTNQFIAVRTTNRLNPEYAALSRNMAGSKSWYQDDGPVCLSEKATMTIFPKQLYGTNSNSPELYNKFVTQDPYNKLGPRHFDDIFKLRRKTGKVPRVFKYVWGAEDKTWVGCGHGYVDGHEFHVPPESDTECPKLDSVIWMDYISGIKLEQEAHNHGWKVLLSLFGSAVQVLTGVLSGSIASVVTGVLSVGDVFDEEKMHKAADVGGFITGVAGAVDAYNGNKKKDEEKKEVPNITNILVLVKNVNANKPLNLRDFGTAAS